MYDPILFAGHKVPHQYTEIPENLQFTDLKDLNNPEYFKQIYSKKVFKSYLLP